MAYTTTVFGVCAVDDGSTPKGNIPDAINLLVKSCVFPRSDFNNVEFKWCTPLKAGASAMVPFPDKIVISRDLRFSDASTLARLIAHEMIHIRQIRNLGFDTFACQYSGEIVSMKGTSCNAARTSGNFLECAAYRFADSVVLRPNDPDTDKDELGDSCDTDDDNDQIIDTNDNCPLVANPDQKDNDKDKMGDACDTDNDNDLVLDINDNCPFVANKDQKDNDKDKFGDACDFDDDNYKIPDTDDNCSLVANPDQKNNDGDSLGDVCDFDDDNDQILDANDNCPFVSNKDQKDVDGDKIGDSCDNCASTANSDQEDKDCDGIGNVCDTEFNVGSSLKCNPQKVPSAIDKRPEFLQKPDWPKNKINLDEKIKLPANKNAVPTQR